MMDTPRRFWPLLIWCWLAWMLPGMAAAAPDKPDVRALIDISGSMKENDPQNLRAPALNLLVDLLPEDSKAGVWTFGMYVNMLVPHGEVDAGWRRDARSKVDEISSVALYTDIENALERATYDIEKGETEGYQRHLILLTDGLVDISEASDERRAEAENKVSRDHILYKMLPKMQQAGYTIHTVALSDGADTRLLEQLSQATGGLAAVAKSADDLMRLFVQAFDRSVPSEQVPLKDNRFFIDKTIQEFTALVFHQPDSKRVILSSPQDEHYTAGLHPDAVRWHHDARYDLVTVKNPPQGEWRIETEEHPDNRVTVISNLKLEVSEVPAMLFKGREQPLEVHFSEDGKLIEREEFLQLMTVTAAMKNAEQGELFSRQLPYTGDNPGYFETALGPLDTLGSQKVVVRVDGKTFRREVVRPVRVVELFDAVVKYRADDETVSHIRLQANTPEIDPARTQLSARVAGQSYPAERTVDGDWQIELGPLDRSRDIRVPLLAQGELRSGEPYKQELQPLTIPALPSQAEPAAATEPEPAVTQAAPEDPFMEPLPQEPEPEEAAEPAEPEADVQPEPVQAAPVVTQPKKEGVSRSDVVLVFGVALINVLLFGVAFWLYRRYMRPSAVDDSVDELDD